MSNNNNLFHYYAEQVIAEAKKAQAAVCLENEINLKASSGHEIRPIPVFEDDQFSLLQHAQQVGGVEILFPTTNNTYLLAYYKQYSEGENISAKVIVNTENYCEARLLAAKELMHLYLYDNGMSANDSAADSATATRTLEDIKILIDNLSTGLSAATNDAQTIVDSVAWIGAAHYLVPDEWVPLLIAIRDEIEQKAPTANAYLHIAQLLRAPATLVKWRLRKE